MSSITMQPGMWSAACCELGGGSCIQHNSVHQTEFDSMHVAAAARKRHYGDAIADLTPDGEIEGVEEPSFEKHPEHGWVYGNHPLATQSEHISFKHMLESNLPAFAFTLVDMPGYKGDLGSCEIRFAGQSAEQDIWSKRRPYSPLETKICNEKCQELLEAGIISPVLNRHPKYASCPTLPLKKDSNGQWTERRFAIDYRKINAATVVQNFAMPLPEDIFRRMQGSKYFTTLDLRAGFMQIPMADADKEKTAFWWGDKLYQFERMPFGLKNSVSIFQTVVNNELRRAHMESQAAAFVDDVAIWSDTMEDHQRHVEQVLRILHSVGLRVHPGKCVFAADRVRYLGHLVTPEGLQPLTAKVGAMRHLKAPANADELRSQLGLFNFYRCYVPRFSAICNPLNALLQKSARFVWEAEQQAAYAALKEAFATPGLILRRPRPELSYYLYTDWSQRGIAAVLNQREPDGKEFMVACISRSLNVHEQRYEAWKGELLAAVWAVKMFRAYLHGAHFYLCTDHRALMWLLTAPEPVGQQARWILSLQEFTFTIMHRPGVENPADAPSRHPNPALSDLTGARIDYQEDGGPRVLPLIIRPDGSFDTEAYEHDRLSRLMGVKPLNHKVPTHSSPAAQACAAWMCQQAVLDDTSLSLLLNAPSTGTLPIDLVAPTHEALLSDEDLADWLPTGAVPHSRSEATMAHQLSLAQLAAHWVTQATTARVEPLPFTPPAPLRGEFGGEPDNHGVRHTRQLCTSSVASTFFAAAQAGIVLYEPFGGMCAGLEMVLRNNIPVAKYL